MKVILNCNSDIGRTGNYGYRAEMIGIKCYNQGILKKFLCRSFIEKEIPKNCFVAAKKSYHLLSLIVDGVNHYIFPRFQSWRLRRDIYDYLMSKEDLGCSIFHTWEYCPKMIQKAREQGAIILRDLHVGITINDDYNLKADFLILPSKFHYDEAIRLGFKKERLFLNPFGVNLKQFYPTQENKKNQFNCIFVGNLEERKGIKDLISAWNDLNLKNAKLFIIGRGNKSTNKFLKQNSSKSIIYYGQISQKKLSALYQKSHVFVFPSIREGSAKVTYEAMACGLPLITTKNSGAIIEDGKEGFIIPIREPEAIKEKILFLYNNPKVRVKMGAKARKKVEGYSWEEYANRVLKIYSKILLMYKKREFIPQEKINPNLSIPNKKTYFDKK